MPQQVSAIKQQADIDQAWKCDQLAIHGIICDQLGEMRRDLPCRHVGLQIEYIVGKNSWPDHIYGVDVWNLRTTLQKAAPRVQCLYCSFRCGEKLDLDAGLLSELLEFQVAPVLEGTIEPGLVN